MKVELKPQWSCMSPDEASAAAARGDYMEGSLVGNDLDDCFEETEQTHQGLIEELMEDGHFGPFEHPKAFIAIEDMSIVVERQITRHRHASFDIQSLRYVELDRDTESPVVLPTSIQEDAVVSREKGLVEIDEATSANQRAAIEAHADYSLNLYQDLIDDGMPRDEARYVIPLGLGINGVMSANLRSWMHVINMRDAGDVQPETREFAKKVLRELKEWAPMTTEAYLEHAKGASKKAQ